MDSKETKQVYAALFEVQKKLYEKGGYIAKSATNPAHKNKYIPLPELLRGIVPLLHAHGLMLVQKNLPSVESGGANVLSIIKHIESGEYITSNCTVPPMTQVGYEYSGKERIQIQKITPQSLGGSITYARRYDLESMFAIPTTDDDGNAASGYDKPKPVKEPMSLWEMLVDYAKIDGLTVKKAKEIMATVGVIEEEDLQKYTAPKAVDLIKEKINE